MPTSAARPGGGAPAVSMHVPLWRSVAAFRVVSLVYAAVLLVVRRANYAHIGWAWAVLGAMVGWTVVTTVGYARPARRTRLLLAADLLVTAGLLLSTGWVQWPRSTFHAAMPVTATWVAGAVLAWAVAWGTRAGTAAAFGLGVCAIALQHRSLVHVSYNGAVLLLMAGALVGYVSTLVSHAERALQRATEIEAASRERERLARGIHDSVLQVLALVQRRGDEVGGEAAEIGRLAGEQGAALRTLIAGDAGQGGSAGELDLRTLLGAEASAAVTLVTPASPVLLAAETARETVAAVRAALDNVARHCGEGARAWVLVEDERAAVTVTVRDDGPGMRATRLAEAAADGRLGVSHAIRGRMRDLGGTADITSSPGNGTEVRLRVPREGRESRPARAGGQSGQPGRLA